VDIQAILSRLGGIKPVAAGEFNPVSEAEIVAIEESLGVRLPESYRTFLATYGASTFNGTSPDNPFIVFRPLRALPPQFKSGKGLFDAFYGAERDAHDGYSLRVRTRFFKGANARNYHSNRR
jgi:SMI1-KNR4 cell-wall